MIAPIDLNPLLLVALGAVIGQVIPAVQWWRERKDRKEERLGAMAEEVFSALAEMDQWGYDIFEAAHAGEFAPPANWVARLKALVSIHAPTLRQDALALEEMTKKTVLSMSRYGGAVMQDNQEKRDEFWQKSLDGIGKLTDVRDEFESKFADYVAREAVSIRRKEKGPG